MSNRYIEDLEYIERAILRTGYRFSTTSGQAERAIEVVQVIDRLTSALRRARGLLVRLLPANTKPVDFIDAVLPQASCCGHASDCLQHDAPYREKGPCSCGVGGTCEGSPGDGVHPMTDKQYRDYLGTHPARDEND